jgi:hypothetical integral membrane protein (TIGR02206 family)
MTPTFEMFSLQHISTLLIFMAVTAIIIVYGKRTEEPLRSDIGMMIAGITFSTLLLDAVYKLVFGTFNIYEDLPFFLCDLVAFILPFILYYRNRKWIGILYFWALGGTLQAIITPDLKEGFPTFHFFRYFIGHAGIIMAILYTVIVRGIRIGWQDFILAVIYAQVYLVAVHMINHMLGSNYSYTMAKPPGGSILDVMGPWPWYLLAGEGLMLVLFLLLLLPFLLTAPAAGQREVEETE